MPELDDIALIRRRRCTARSRSARIRSAPWVASWRAGPMSCGEPLVGSAKRRGRSEQFRRARRSPGRRLGGCGVRLCGRPWSRIASWASIDVALADFEASMWARIMAPRRRAGTGCASSWRCRLASRIGMASRRWARVAATRSGICGRSRTWCPSWMSATRRARSLEPRGGGVPPFGEGLRLVLRDLPQGAGQADAAVGASSLQTGADPLDRVDARAVSGWAAGSGDHLEGSS
jgi:hypothetical protein